MRSGLSIVPPRTPVWQAIAASLAVLVLAVASGNLECERLFETPEVAHGREVYGRMCAVCHGTNGEGYKADQAPQLANPRFLESVSDAFLIAAITNGRAGSTMSAWGVAHSGPLAPADVLAVVAYLHTWRPGEAPKLDDRTIEGDLPRGAELFAKQCAGCHGPRGVRGRFESIGNPELLATASNGLLRHAVESGRPGTQMAAFGDTLGPQGIEDVLAFVRSLASGTGAPPILSAPPARPPPLPLGPVPLNPTGPEPRGFDDPSGFTKGEIIKRELDRGAKMGILDARAPSDYTGDHIAGAVSVPFYDPEPYLAALPKDAWLVAYCGCPHAESGQLAQKLRAKGFKKVTVLDEGLRFWSGKKYGTHKGLLP